MTSTPRTRANFTLAPATHAILADAGNASRYLDEAVRLRDRRWRRALATAREIGAPRFLRARLEHVRAGTVDDVTGIPARQRRALRILARELHAGNAALEQLLEAPARRRA